MTRPVVMGRVQRPAGFYPRRAALTGGQKQGKGTADARTTSRLGGQMQTADRHHRGGCRQIGHHHGRMPITQRFFHRPEQHVAFGGCDEQDMARRDVTRDGVRAEEFSRRVLRDPDHRSPQLCGNGHRECVPRLPTEFVHASQPQRDFGIAQRDLRRGAVGASGQKGVGTVHGSSLRVLALFSRDSSHLACQPLPRIGAIGQVRQRIALKNKVPSAVIPILRATLVAIWLAFPAKAADLTVFAAASLGDAMAELATVWTADTGQDVTLVLAGSSTLARQIDAGAPADVYVSANETWMDWLVDRGRAMPESRVNIASNRLVLVAQDPAAASDADITAQTDFVGALGPSGRLAIALPEAVPAGIYAKTALTALGLWDGLNTRLAPTDNVRAALALVALGEAPLAIVYVTDAIAEPRVVTAGVFPEDSHPPIRYPAAVVTDTQSPKGASEFVAWLVSPAAQDVLSRYGFLPVGISE